MTSKTPARKSILIVAGETSGDLLGAAILQQWNKKGGKKLSFWGFGGGLMKNAGVEILRDIRELSVIGFWEALANYKRLSSYLDELVDEAAKRNVAGAVLIDYPGFNLKLAKKLKALKIPVYQVVSPQLWAWHFSRIHTIRKYVDRVLCLYKFELKMYRDHGIEAEFIGHPVVQKIADFQKSHAGEIARLSRPKRKYRKVALLPGSRKSEISRHLPFLIEVAARFHQLHPDTLFEIPSASDHTSVLIGQYRLPAFISVRKEAPYMTLATSDSAIVCSGTATLECALFNLPFLLIYKTSWATWFLGKKLIRIPYIGLVNILRNSFVTKEFIQSDMEESAVFTELENITFDKDYIAKMQNEFAKVKAEVYSKNPALLAAAFFSGVFKE